MYKFRASTGKCLAANEQPNSMLWHRRLGHLNFQSMCKMRDGAVLGINFDDNLVKLKNCETCAAGKQCRFPFTKNDKTSSRVLELVHSDLCGPMETQSIGKAKYILTFVDDYSRKTLCYFLNSKEIVFEKIKDFKQYVENQTGKRIKAFRTDNGTEYITHQVEIFL